MSVMADSFYSHLSSPRKRGPSIPETSAWGAMDPRFRGDDSEQASHPPRIERRLLAGAVAPERALLADRVGALEDPVLPGGEAGEDLRLHGFGAAEAQIGLEPGEAVGREARALLQEHADLVLPVDVVEREGDEALPRGRFGVERLADLRLRLVEIGRIGEEAARQ